MTAVLTEPTLIDTREMNVVHSVFRREFRLAPGLVRGVASGDTRRAAIVAKHLARIEGMLHHHHTGEDELLWPKLLERVPDELAPIVHLMEAQHERVAGLLPRIEELRSRWVAGAGECVGTVLADLYDELFVALVEHLEAEETQLLPLAARCITEEEWAQLGERGRAHMPTSEVALMFGALAYEGDPEVIATMIGAAPLPVRLIVPRLGRRAFRKYAIAIHGTPTP